MLLAIGWAIGRIVSLSTAALAIPFKSAERASIGENAGSQLD